MENLSNILNTANDAPIVKDLFGFIADTIIGMIVLSGIVIFHYKINFDNSLSIDFLQNYKPGLFIIFVFVVASFILGYIFIVISDILRELLLTIVYIRYVNGQKIEILKKSKVRKFIFNILGGAVVIDPLSEDIFDQDFVEKFEKKANKVFQLVNLDHTVNYLLSKHLVQTEKHGFKKHIFQFQVNLTEGFYFCFLILSFVLIVLLRGNVGGVTMKENLRALRVLILQLRQLTCL